MYEYLRNIILALCTTSKSANTEAEIIVFDNIA